MTRIPFSIFMALTACAAFAASSFDGPDTHGAKLIPLKKVFEANQAAHFVLVTTSDVDLDADEDVLLADDRGAIHIMINRGEGKLDGPHRLTDPAQDTPGPIDLKLSDLDSDNDEDILLVDSLGCVRKIVNMGQGRLGKLEVISQPVSQTAGHTRLEISDVDLDNDEDMVLVSDAGVVYKIENTGMGSFGLPKQASTIPGLTPGYIDVVLADLDLDNDEEVLVVDSLANVYKIVNTSGGNFGHAEKLIGPINPEPGAVDLALSDIDWDGYDDILLMVKDGSILSLKNKGKGTFATAATRVCEPVSTKPGYMAMAMSDIDSENNEDIAIVSSGTGIFLVENSQPGRFDKPYPISEQFELPAGRMVVVREDVNGDGSEDTLILDSTGSLYVMHGEVELIVDDV